TWTNGPARWTSMRSRISGTGSSARWTRSAAISSRESRRRPEAVAARGRAGGRGARAPGRGGRLAAGAQSGRGRPPVGRLRGEWTQDAAAAAVPGPARGPAFGPRAPAGPARGRDRIAVAVRPAGGEAARAGAPDRTG